MRVARTAVVGLTALGLLPGVAGAKGPAAEYHPAIHAANFVGVVDNPYLPLVPGTQFKFVEKLGKHTSENDVVVTHDTRVVMGVTCVVVSDRVTEKGVLKEETFDWYAQDKDGNVWNFGEDTKEYDAKGHMSTEGSWEAGVGRNQPGIIMPGHPAPGPAFRQEYGPGHAEDMGQVIAIKESVTVPYGAFTNCVRTKEWSLLEPGTEKKWYAPGIGVVRTESTTHEVATLVAVTKP